MNDGSGFGGDPFQFYYAYYLPNQAMLSMRNRPIDTLNQFTASRQYYAQTDRRSLYNPISATGDDTYDTLHPYAGQGKERNGTAVPICARPVELRWLRSLALLRTGGAVFPRSSCRPRS